MKTIPTAEEFFNGNNGLYTAYSVKNKNKTNNIMKILLIILHWIAAVTLYLIIISVGVYLIESEIVNLKYKEITTYFYYFGLGILSWFPCNKILNSYK